jgi:hypothetical protein
MQTSRLQVTAGDLYRHQAMIALHRPAPPDAASLLLALSETSQFTSTRIFQTSSLGARQVSAKIAFWNAREHRFLGGGEFNRNIEAGIFHNYIIPRQIAESL